MRKKVTDFSELQALSKRIEDAVRFADTTYSGSRYSNQKILEAGATELMNHIVKETPKGKDRSNWYNYNHTEGDHSSHYFLPGRSSRAGTLKRGWVTDQSDNPQYGQMPTYAIVQSFVKRTPVQRKLKGISMEFHNVAPYSKAIEDGHDVRMPYWYGPDGYATPRGQGPIVGHSSTHRRFTWQAILHSKEDVKKAMKKECIKMLKQVVKG